MSKCPKKNISKEIPTTFWKLSLQDTHYGTGTVTQFVEHLPRKYEFISQYHQNNFFKLLIIIGCWWCTPVILATWEVEIKRTAVGGKPRQIVCKTPSPK
jgi:hypothetical protein